jgi:hypothetical protein
VDEPGVGNDDVGEGWEEDVGRGVGQLEAQEAVGDEARAEGVDGWEGTKRVEALAGPGKEEGLVNGHVGDDPSRLDQAPQTLLGEPDVGEG